jgi:hypothetical protein
MFCAVRQTHHETWFNFWFTTRRLGSIVAAKCDRKLALVDQKVRSICARPRLVQILTRTSSGRVYPIPKSQSGDNWLTTPRERIDATTPPTLQTATSDLIFSSVDLRTHLLCPRWRKCRHRHCTRLLPTPEALEIAPHVGFQVCANPDQLGAVPWLSFVPVKQHLFSFFDHICMLTKQPWSNLSHARWQAIDQVRLMTHSAIHVCAVRGAE